MKRFNGSPKRKVVCSNHIRDVTSKGMEEFIRNSSMFFYIKISGSDQMTIGKS